MKKRGQGKIKYLPLLLILTLAISGVFVTAGGGGFSDWFRSLITGEATSDTTTASVTISNSGPSVHFVEAISATNPTINSTTRITFRFNVTDPDGIGDIENATVRVNATKSGETTIENKSCRVFGTVNATTTSFQCSIDMNFYGDAGTWTIAARANDSGGSSSNNNTRTFTYNELNAMALNVTSLTWGSITVLSTNQGSNNDPVAVFNIGNANLYTNVTATDLLGYTTASELIPASYFHVDDASEGCSGTELVNATGTNISAAITLDPAVWAFGDRYFCLTDVYDNSTAQAYNTTGYGAWTIGTTVAA